MAGLSFMLGQWRLRNGFWCSYRVSPLRWRFPPFWHCRRCGRQRTSGWTGRITNGLAPHRLIPGLLGGGPRRSGAPPDGGRARLHYVHSGIFTDDWDAPYLAGILPSPRYADAPERFATLGLAMLLLHGRQDMTFPAHLTDQAAALIPTATPVILEEAGHMAHIDQPELWLQAVESFLEP